MVRVEGETRQRKLGNAAAAATMSRLRLAVEVKMLELCISRTMNVLCNTQDCGNFGLGSERDKQQNCKARVRSGVRPGNLLLALLLGAQLRGATALLLAAVHGTGGEAGIAAAQERLVMSVDSGI